MHDSAGATQRVVKMRRDYNTWVADESLEDYALRFTPRAFRKWSEMRVANTAFGASSFLVLEAIGGAILVSYGFLNAFWAFMAIGLIIFLTGLPISYYAARYGVDMDLLTRGAGFGYIGSTFTSLIYASFTFILFSLEGAIMAYALELALGIPPAIGYLISAMAVIPLVTHGITLISRFQAWTQPIWLVLLALPYMFIMVKSPEALSGLWSFAGNSGETGHFSWALFGSAVTVGLALITQIGEQVDYLRFMPEKRRENRLKWHAGVLIGGPGWILLGIPKMLGGALLAYLAIRAGVSLDKVVDPNQMYLHAFGQVFTGLGLAAAVTALFVVVSQLKINITNAYAGSLAWSNFFARLTHSHPGRVVWVIFNVLIALMLMEMNVFRVLEQVLGLYSNIAISWVVAVVADLVVNKPLGLSPKGIEFRRAHLYDINPVGVGATLIASALSIAAFTGVMGESARGYSAFIAMVAAFVAAPILAWLTQGRYYLVRTPEAVGDGPPRAHACSVCEKSYEADDMAHCPAYQGHICSLCCSLDARCHDLCRPKGRLSAQWASLLQKILPRAFWHHISSGLGHYVLIFTGMLTFLVALMSLLYYHEALSLGSEGAAILPQIRFAFFKIFAVLVLVSGISAWWFVLTSESRRVAQKESNQQTSLLMREIDAHRITDAQLQKAKHAAESANQAKSRYVSAISHELRTPLNSILGYSQILDADETIPENRRQAIGVIHKSGEHLLSLIEGVLDIARIESGKLKLDIEEVHFPDSMQQIVRMFELQARDKGLDFSYHPANDLPVIVRADKKRLGQILINILGNAVKFTQRGSVKLTVRYAREMAQFEIEDTGPGIPAEELDHVFEPFVRGSAAKARAGGTGLGLTISKMLVDLMGGELFVSSVPGQGTVFQIRLFLPHVHNPSLVFEKHAAVRTGYAGERKRILIVDNEDVDREMLANVLEPLGFLVRQAASGFECLELCGEFEFDLIFMDLAMPGIDGWETIRRLRREQRRNAKIAIVSANAFDKGLENDVGIQPQDFILKPLNVSELLDWIGDHFALQWESQGMQAQPLLMSPPVKEALVYPPVEFVYALNDLVSMGYVRGILKKLDEIEALDVRYKPFAEQLRPLARQFQFDVIESILQNADSHDDNHTGQKYH